MLLRNEPDSPALDGILTVLLLLPFVLAMTTESVKVAGDAMAEDQKKLKVVALWQQSRASKALKLCAKRAIDFVDRRLGTEGLLAGTAADTAPTVAIDSKARSKKNSALSSASSSVDIDPPPALPLESPGPATDDASQLVASESLPPGSFHQGQEAEEAESPIGGLLASWSDRAKQFLSPKGGAPNSAEQAASQHGASSSQHEASPLGGSQLAAVAESPNLSA